MGIRSSIQSFGLSLFIVLAFITIGIGFLFGIDNPVPWIMLGLLAVVPYVHKKMIARHFVSWDDDLSVGVEAIDEDHKHLLRLINNLQTAVYYPTGEAFERQALKELVDYTKFHFKREEDLMTEYDFPGYEEHKQHHEEMIGKVSGFLNAYEKDREGAIEDLTQFLKSWLVNHIGGADQQYAAYLQQKGLS